MLENVRIVLVDTSHPGNIGAAARAMKNMCLSRLYLVTPKKFPHPEAVSRASGADDLLAAATVCENLDEALAGCSLAIGASARLRRLSAPPLGPRSCAEKVAQAAQGGEVALVFGREHSGLTNEELSRCHYLMHIPCNPEYSSLNVAAAVQIMAYEVMLASGAEEGLDNEERGQGAPVPSEEMERLFEHMQEALVEIDFLDPENPRIMMRRLRRLFNRARPNQVEYNILRGILTAAQRPHRK